MEQLGEAGKGALEQVAATPQSELATFIASGSERRDLRALVNILSRFVPAELPSTLDISGSTTSTGDAIVFSSWLSRYKVLASITFGNNQAVTMKTDMVAADFSGKNLGASGAIIMAAFLPKCRYKVHE